MLAEDGLKTRKVEKKQKRERREEREKESSSKEAKEKEKVKYGEERKETKKGQIEMCHFIHNCHLVFPRAVPWFEVRHILVEKWIILPRIRNGSLGMQTAIKASQWWYPACLIQRSVPPSLPTSWCRPRILESVVDETHKEHVAAVFLGHPSLPCLALLHRVTEQTQRQGTLRATLRDRVFAIETLSTQKK